MELNLGDQVLIQIYHLALYFGALIIIAITVGSFLASWVQRLTGTTDGMLALCFRSLVAVGLVFFFGPGIFLRLQEVLKMILAG